MAIDLLEYETDRSTMVRDDRVAGPGTSQADTVDAAMRSADPGGAVAEAGSEPVAAYWCCGIECC